MITLSYLLHRLLSLFRPTPTKETRNTPPHKLPSRQLSGQDQIHEEVWDYLTIAGTEYRVRYVFEPPNRSAKNMFRGGREGYGREGYVIDRKGLLGWEKQFNDTLYGGLSSLRDALYEDLPRLAREADCSHPDRTETHVAVGGEMVPADKCTECGHLDYNW